MIKTAAAVLLAVALVGCPGKPVSNPGLDPYNWNDEEWCVPMEVAVDGIMHATSGCADTEDLCKAIAANAEKYGSAAGIKSVGFCQKL